MFYRRILSTLAGLALLTAAACGSSTEPSVNDAPGSDPAGSACLVGDPDCYETGAETDGDPSLGMCAPDVTDCVDVAVDEG